MQKNKYNDYDEAKKMLNTLRNLNNRYSTQNHLKEQIEDESNEDLSNVKQDKNNIVVVNDVDININTTNEEDFDLDEEQKTSFSQIIDNFKSQVTQMVDFEPGFTILDNQIRLDATLSDFDLGFVLIVGEESGLYLNCEMLKMNKDALTILEKLNTFQDGFKTSMEVVLNKRNNNL
jgi:hypothetical protein